MSLRVNCELCLIYALSLPGQLQSSFVDVSDGLSVVKRLPRRGVAWYRRHISRLASTDVIMRIRASLQGDLNLYVVKVASSHDCLHFFASFFRRVQSVFECEAAPVFLPLIWASDSRYVAM